MIRLQVARRIRGAGLPLLAAGALCLAGCAHTAAVNPFAVGGINPDSTVAAEVNAASHANGSYPRFAQIPALPSDVRTIPAWRTAVVSEWGTKRKTEREAAALPFTLANTEEWAQRTRAKIPSGEQSGPTPNVSAQIEAFAAAERARATPPPAPQ